MRSLLIVQILNGVKGQDWQRIRQVAMEVHVASDLTQLSQFFSERDFTPVSVKKLKGGMGFIWATKQSQAVIDALMKDQSRL